MKVIIFNNHDLYFPVLVRSYLDSICFVYIPTDKICFCKITI